MLSHRCATASALMALLRKHWDTRAVVAAGGVLLDFRDYAVPRKAWLLANGTGTPPGLLTLHRAQDLPR